MTHTPDHAGVDWHALAKRHNEITAGMLHGINGQEKTDLYGRDFDAEALRRTVESFRPVDGSTRLISTDAADDQIERAIRTWKFNADQANAAADDWKARYLKAVNDARIEAARGLVDYVRTTAHGVKGKLRREGYELLADQMEKRLGGVAASEEKAS